MKRKLYIILITLFLISMLAGCIKQNGNQQISKRPKRVERAKKNTHGVNAPCHLFLDGIFVRKTAPDCCIFVHSVAPFFIHSFYHRYCIKKKRFCQSIRSNFFYSLSSLQIDLNKSLSLSSSISLLSKLFLFFLFPWCASVCGDARSQT